MVIYAVKKKKKKKAEVVTHSHVTETRDEIRSAVLCLVAQSCLSLCNPVDCSLPGFFAHGIFQARVLAQQFPTNQSAILLLVPAEHSCE